VQEIERFQRIAQLFDAASQLHARDRGPYLERECPDPAMRDQVAQLIDADLRRSPQLGTEIIGGAVEHAAATPAVMPERIGGYRVLKLLGEGGMGVVYLAEQDNPRRQVALKVLRTGIVSPSLLRRFEHEAQILGRLRHAGIAQIFEAGTAQLAGGSSQPFFAMEYLDGKPLNEYAAAHRIGIPQRVDLFIRVCDAVQHAHQKGVIHRDLKPGNILVTEETERRRDGETKCAGASQPPQARGPLSSASSLRLSVSSSLSAQPKILDFGVARAVDGDVLAFTQQTSVGQLIGTLLYMSPEQIAGDPLGVDVRSDVYSLGVILHELLTGVLPYDLSGRSLTEMIRIVREVPPRHASTLSRGVDRDLDTIVAKTLEKEPGRRYPSAAALADDLRRWQNHEPITARPPTFRYQFSRFARRNQAAVIGAAGMLIALVGGILATSRQAYVAQRERARAEQESAVARETSEFLREMLSSVDPARARGQIVTVRQTLDQAALRLDRMFGDQPLVRAALHRTMGVAYYSIGAFEQAESQLRRALVLNTTTVGRDAPDALEIASELAIVLDRVGKSGEAESFARTALENAERTQGADSPVARTLRTTNALILQSQNRVAEAEALYRRVLAEHERIDGPDSPETARAISNLGSFLLSKRRIEEAEPLLRRCLDIWRRAHGDDHPSTLVARSNLAALRIAAGDFEEAERLSRAVISDSERVLGREHWDTIFRIRHLAQAQFQRGNYEAAEITIRDAYERARKGLGEENIETLACLGALVNTLIQTRKLDEAGTLAQKAYDTSIALNGANHEETRRAATLFVDLYEALGNKELQDEWTRRAQVGAAPATVDRP
jgi:serine/threonine protein kinase/tetratricopeptide (TPR) repeat protein